MEGPIIAEFSSLNALNQKASHRVRWEDGDTSKRVNERVTCFLFATEKAQSWKKPPWWWAMTWQGWCLMDIVTCSGSLEKGGNLWPYLMHAHEPKLWWDCRGCPWFLVSLKLHSDCENQAPWISSRTCGTCWWSISSMSLRSSQPVVIPLVNWCFSYILSQCCLILFKLNWIPESRV